MFNAWLLLILAGCFEVGMTTFLTLSEGLTRAPWRGLFLLCGAISFFLLSRANLNIPMGTAYAVWTGIGAAGTALVGMLFFREPATWPRLALIVVMIGCIAGLKWLDAKPAP